MMKILNYIKENYLLLLILALATFLRFYHLDYQSIWLDEVHTMKEADPGLTIKEFDRMIMGREGIPHFYFLCVRFFFEIFGYSTFTARMFSAVIGIASVYAIYLLGKVIFNNRAGLLAAALLCVNQFHIYHSQEARSYGLLLFFTIVAFYRLVLFINKPGYNNAILFGVFAGMITHAHPVGLTVVAAQFLILLFVLVKTARDERKNFFLYSFVSGIMMLIVFYPVYRIVAKVSDLTSFWILPPTPDTLSNIVYQYLGASELTAFIFNVLFAYYAFHLFRQKTLNDNIESIKSNKQILGFIIITIWVGVGFLIPLIRSYLQVPMMIDRYFINLLPALVLVLAIGMALIRNKTVRMTVIISVMVLSLIDVFIVKEYYSRVSKAQYKEITTLILKKNERQQHKIISAYGWLMSYFLNQDETNPPTDEYLLENYVADMRNNVIPLKSFWYLDGNSRPYSLGPEDEQFLADNFYMKEKIEKFDTWARHYISKTQPNETVAEIGTLDLKEFKPFNSDGAGNLMFFENSVVKSPLLTLEAGNYILTITGNSLPEKPINGENAHFKVKLNSTEIGDFSMSENKGNNSVTIPFRCDESKKARIQLIFDNDLAQGKEDRNAIIYAIKLDRR